MFPLLPLMLAAHSPAGLGGLFRESPLLHHGIDNWNIGRRTPKIGGSHCDPCWKSQPQPPSHPRSCQIVSGTCKCGLVRNGRRWTLRTESDAEGPSSSRPLAPSSQSMRSAEGGRILPLWPDPLHLH
ncbi:hypothetical protein BT67DRAFT_189799 [Trichocladium antarcticum]|uniref:Uncharacterized protein n=1 Tax=Trichocladium antarcticum TaxID=1450529 RepID=A0AAN6ZG99_9PEZI|nr:hypothetical protein BT67DRAFT_189799 [Trichocladium antarcticum]